MKLIMSQAVQGRISENSLNFCGETRKTNNSNKQREK